jgi:hypothetical protein
VIIKLNVLNYSNSTSDNLVQMYIDKLFKVLSNKGVNIAEVNIQYNNTKFFSIVKKFVDENPNNRPLIADVMFLMALNKYYSKRERFVIIGENITTENLWGDAFIGFLTVIKHITEQNIWHEVAHVLGAEDHYIKDSDDAIENCVDNSCIMRFGRNDGTLCTGAIDEIKLYLEKN